MDYAQTVGYSVVRAVLDLSGLLRTEWAPGVVVLGLLAALVVAILHLLVATRRRASALSWLHDTVAATTDPQDFSDRSETISRSIQSDVAGSERRSVASAWKEYKETLVVYTEGQTRVLRNAVRPGVFFNLEDLHFGVGFWRILPGLFVSIGLFLTFLGLIAALDSMGQAMEQAGEISQGAMTDFLTIASAKFIMSLTGLACSIVFTITLRARMGGLETALVRLNSLLEERLSFVSLEELAAKQLEAVREQREHFRSIGFELVAELGRPLREELPQAIATSVTDAMAPLMANITQTSSEGIGDLVRNLSSRLSEDVGGALGEASTRLGEATGQIGVLLDKMDQSSGRMGSEMENAVAALGQGLTDLRTGMHASANATAGAFSEGVDTLLAAMGESLDAIRHNTAEGAQAMSSAAAELRAAAEGIRSELAAAAQDGAHAARAQLEASATDITASIGHAGETVHGAFEESSREIARLARELAEHAGSTLLSPISAVNEELERMVRALSSGADQATRAAEGMRVGADATTRAAGSFQTSAEALASAAEPVRDSLGRIETSTKGLSDSMRQVADSTRRNAESAAHALQTAQELLGGEQRALAGTLQSLSTALERMREQGTRLDEMDAKLGAAFDQYTQQVEAAVHALFEHVRNMQATLAPALDTLQQVVEQAQEFAPQVRRR